VLDLKLKFTPSHESARNWMAPSPLQKLYWNVTRACNFRCSICFTDAGVADPNEMSSAEALAAIDAAAAAGVRDIIISGGEPFERPDIERLLEHMGARGITARIATNGSRLDDDRLRRLKERTRVTSFQISVDTLDPLAYARIHGVSADYLDTALAAMERVARHGFHATASARLTPDTLPGLPDLLRLAHDRRWATLTIHLPVGTRRACDSFPPGTDQMALLEPLLAAFAELERHWLVETYIPWAERDATVRRLSDRIRFVHCGCRAGRDRLCVGPDGALTPCVCLDVPDAVVGNIRTDDLRRVFAEAPLCRLFRAPKEHGICADCGYVDRCGGGCRAMAWARGGTFLARDMDCPLLRRHRPAVVPG
jgi:radical SAM protein with 4Fe4S-binding SPASM domain